MKKLIAFISIVVMLLVSSACAEKCVVSEKFSIRNGISYGTTREEIKQIESDNGSRLDPDNGWSDFYPGVNLSYTTSLAGHECSLLYFLDENDTLSGFRYIFNTSSAYDVVINSLREKYGFGTYNKVSPFKTRSTTFSSSYVILNPQFNLKSWWLVEFEDCSVCIEAIYVEVAGSTQYRVDYTIFTHEEVDNVLKSTEKSLNEGL